jgi:hypothetical protein
MICLLLFSSQTVFVLYAFQNIEGKEILNNNFATCYVLMWNKVSRKTFGCVNHERTGSFWVVLGEPYHDLCRLSHLITLVTSRRVQQAGCIVWIVEWRNACRTLVGKLLEKLTLGRPRRRCKDNIRMNLREMGYEVEEGWNSKHDYCFWQCHSC